MLWILFVVGAIGVLIMLILTLFEIFSSLGDWDEARAYACKLVIFLVIGLVGLFGLAGIDCLSYEETVQTGDWELVALTDNSEVSGNGHGGLFYVHVSLTSNDVYSFYYRLDNDGIKRGKVSVNDSTIFEKDDCTPHVVQHTTYTKNKMPKVLRAILAFGYGEKSHVTTEFYIPEGSVLKTYSLDGQ